MPKVPDVIPSAAAGQKNDKISKNTKKFEKYKQNDKNNVKKIIDPSYNPQKFTEVSVMHLLNDSKPKALKKTSYGSSNKKIGCSWTQFTGNIDAAIDHVAISIDAEYVSYQHEKTTKILYFMFYNEEGAEKCMNTPIYYNGITVELYQTVTLEEGTQIITIPSTNSINIRFVVEAVNNAFTKNRIIYDFSAYKNKRSGKFHTFGMKFLFKKTIDSFEIPTFLEIDKYVLALTYTPKSAIETKLKTMFADINKKMSQEAQKKSKESEEHTIKSMQKKIDSFFGKSTKNEQKIILGEVHNEIAPQVKAIKDSTKPTKLQSLEFNNKNKDIKQLEKINLELSDQPIYADSSCPSTPNFKKEWDKSDENNIENNFSVAVIDMNFVNEPADYNGFNDAEMPHLKHKKKKMGKIQKLKKTEDQNFATSELLNTSKTAYTSHLMALDLSFLSQVSKSHNAPKLAKFGPGLLEFLQKSSIKNNESLSFSQIFNK
ncbi:hypothetical protein BB561_006911 [Smittium simulii]|uniref:Uncharacterized protein n=1 Tax=Smittium simulii TaxID=133385 RepID=A0A2T9Y019_9FUNG|nr:hypothetical protein BB561_006911 [Smittium simulii]